MVRLCVLCGVGGCAAESGTYDDVPIEEAWFDHFHVSSVTIIAGSLQGDALLGFQEPGGSLGSLPVKLVGGAVGLAFDVAWDVEGHDESVEIDLTDVDTPMVSDVLGTYEGAGSAGVLGVGLSRRRLRNDAGAYFSEDHFVAAGLSMFVGHEWLDVRVGGNDDER